MKHLIVVALHGQHFATLEARTNREGGFSANSTRNRKLHSCIRNVVLERKDENRRASPDSSFHLNLFYQPKEQWNKGQHGYIAECHTTGLTNQETAEFAEDQTAGMMASILDGALD